MTWVEKFLVLLYGKAGAATVLDDIDHRYILHNFSSLHLKSRSFFMRLALVPPFSRLRGFPQGRRFKQWTGDDSKGLMKVCLKEFEIN